MHCGGLCVRLHLQPVGTFVLTSVRIQRFTCLCGSSAKLELRTLVLVGVTQFQFQYTNEDKVLGSNPRIYAYLTLQPNSKKYLKRFERLFLKCVQDTIQWFKTK